MSIKKGSNYTNNEYFTHHTDEDAEDIWTSITLDDVQKAVLGTGTYSVVYKLIWEVAAEEDDEDAKTYTQTITLNINANKIIINDAREASADNDDKVLWNADKATIYKMSNPAATPADENKTTEENKKDDVPKTGEVIYIRRRQRKRRNSKICNLG